MKDVTRDQKKMFLILAGWKYLYTTPVDDIDWY